MSQSLAAKIDTSNEMPKYMRIAPRGGEGESLLHLIRMQLLPNKSFVYGVIATSERGEVCRFVGIHDPATGNTSPSTVVNFIAAGGFGNSPSRRITGAEKDAIKQEIAYWVSHASRMELPSGDSLDVGSAVLSLVAKVPRGIQVVDQGGVPDHSDHLVNLGLPYSVTRLAASAGLRIIITNPRDAAQSLVNSNYVVITEGEWNSASEFTSITSDLSVGFVKFLRDHGLRAEKPYFRNGG
jgi:hypothetical protein